MLAPAWGFVVTAFLAVTTAPPPASTGGRFTLVGRVVGEGAEAPPFWREYERVSASGDRARYDAFKQSQDPYDRALAIYLAPHFADLAFVESALADTRFVNHGVGCIITIERIGSLAYALIRGGVEPGQPASAGYDNQRRIALARSILRSPGLIHLHDAAGVELGDLLALEKRGGCAAFAALTAGQLGVLDAAALGRLLTSIDLPWRESDRRGASGWRLRREVMTCALASRDLPDDAKQYLIDYTYARAPGMEEGRRFHAAALRVPTTPALAAYESALYAVFEQWKPLVAQLYAVQSTAAMHAQAADIGRLFTAEHPMLLADVLGLDNNAVSHSAPLRRKKAQAVLRLVRACHDRGLYYQHTLAEARLVVLERAAYARGLSSPQLPGMGFPARDYGELERLLGIGE